MKFQAAVQRFIDNKKYGSYPATKDPRFREGMIFPAIHPRFRFKFSAGLKVFTIGSCFAREIESILDAKGVMLPTMSLRAPSAETFGAATELLNEYNPATIAQRITYAFRGEGFGKLSIVPSSESEETYCDLLLFGSPYSSIQKRDVCYERILERRQEIEAIYRELPASEIVVITLGFVEAWRDEETGLYLNRFPPYYFASKHPERFTFHRFDVAQTMAFLEEVASTLDRAGKKVILTVSPVPIGSTFTDSDCVIANQYSKSVLRVCAEQIIKLYSNFDYFPSYEIVRSGGLGSYTADNIHVNLEVVKLVTQYMVEQYSEN